MMLLGAAITLAVMGVVYLASRGGMGDGDVRLSPLLGAYLGCLNPGFAPVGLFFGFLLGAIVGVSLMVTRQGRPAHGGAVRAVPRASAPCWPSSSASATSTSCCAR